MNAFFEAIARESPRGFWPRSFSGEQTYWTVAGVSGDTESALVSEDGAVEPSAGAFSVEPFLFVGRAPPDLGGRRDATDVGRGRPADPARSPGGRRALPRGRRTRLGESRRRDAVGPVSRREHRRREANPRDSSSPCAQSRSILRRSSSIGPAGLRRFEVFVDGRRGDGRRTAAGFTHGRRPRDSGRFRSIRGASPDVLADGGLPSSKSADDPFGHASGALAFDFDLAAGASDEITIELPIHPYQSAPPPAASFESRQEAARAFSARLDQASRAWRERLDRVVFVGPAEARELFERPGSTSRTSWSSGTATALRPGTRAYARSWIRDGAMMAAALLRMGHAEEARSYADWYVRYQSPDGRVPCCVDRRGADAVVENDSHGELLYLDRGSLAVHARPAVARRDASPRRRRGVLDRPGTSAPAHGRSSGRPSSGSSSAFCPSRSATRAIPRSPSIPTGTTSGRSRA